MSTVIPEIGEEVREFIERQKMFFVATAPLATDGHINVSPKGLDALRFLDSRTVAYLDIFGSGIETVAHLRQNGRITMMFCAFEGPPRIVRLYGKGRAAPAGSAEFQKLRPLFPAMPGERSIIVIELDRVADSCGMAVPLFKFEGQRTQLLAAAEKKGPEGVADFCRQRNATSIDGLPGLPA